MFLLLLQYLLLWYMQIVIRRKKIGWSFYGILTVGLTGLSQYKLNQLVECILKSIHSKLVSFSQVHCADVTVVLIAQSNVIWIYVAYVNILIRLFLLNNSFIERVKWPWCLEAVMLKVTGYAYIVSHRFKYYFLVIIGYLVIIIQSVDHPCQKPHLLLGGWKILAM